MEHYAYLEYIGARSSTPPILEDLPALPKTPPKETRTPEGSAVEDYPPSPDTPPDIRSPEESPVKGLLSSKEWQAYEKWAEAQARAQRQEEARTRSRTADWLALDDDEWAWRVNMEENNSLMRDCKALTDNLINSRGLGRSGRSANPNKGNQNAAPSPTGYSFIVPSASGGSPSPASSRTKDKSGTHSATTGSPTKGAEVLTGSGGPQSPVSKISGETEARSGTLTPVKGREDQTTPKSPWKLGHKKGLSSGGWDRLEAHVSMAPGTPPISPEEAYFPEEIPKALRIIKRNPDRYLKPLWPESTSEAEANPSPLLPKIASVPTIPCSPLDSSSLTVDEGSYAAPGQPPLKPAWMQEKFAKQVVRGNFMTLVAKPIGIEDGEWIAHQSKIQISASSGTQLTLSHNSS
jgi:hypothetical protein